MGLLDALLGRRDVATQPLYHRIVQEARLPHWYLAGRVPDTIDGRFDMVATLLSVVLLRLESDAAGAPSAAKVTERFVEDMEGQVRELGFGDVVVGKHVGRMMSMLGGRLGAYRTALAGGVGDEGLDAALLRNLYRGEHPGDDSLAYVHAGVLAWRDRVGATAASALLAGQVA